MMRDIHIGSIIRQKLSESSMTIKEFSGKINCDRTTVYDIFKRKSIDVERLIKISQVLNYDFINEVYYNQKIPVITPSTVFIAIEIDENTLQNLHLPDNITRLIKKQ
jgi:predicted transcriptional regulator